MRSGNRQAIRLSTDGNRTVTGVEVLTPSGDTEVVRARHFVIAAGVMESVRLLLASCPPEFPHGIGNQNGLVGRFVHVHTRPRVHVVRTKKNKHLTGVYRTYRFCDEFRRLGMGAACVDINFIEPDPSVDVTLETEPVADNRIRLDARRRDAWGRPVAVLEYKATELDRRTRAHAEVLQTRLANSLLPPGAVVRKAEEKCCRGAIKVSLCALNLPFVR